MLRTFNIEFELYHTNCPEIPKDSDIIPEFEQEPARAVGALIGICPRCKTKIYMVVKFASDSATPS